MTIPRPFLVLFLLAALVTSALAADKPTETPWCDDSSPGYCDPVAVDPARAIPPDLPPAAKLRRQLAKERRQHAAAMRACRAAR